MAKSEATHDAAGDARARMVADGSVAPPPVTGLPARVRIVLSHPSHPGNIGAAARALRTMGLGQLWLVNPARFPDAQADARAAHAVGVLRDARVVGSLAEALRGTVRSIAAVGHAYELSHPARPCREVVAETAAVLRAAPEPADVAVVFGTEAYGLSVDEVRLCTDAAHIPADPDCASLNLAAAVQVFAYEFRLALAPEVAAAPPDGQEVLAPATHESIEALHAHLERALTAIGFHDPVNPKRLLPRLRRLIARTRLEDDEVRWLRGFLTRLEHPIRPQESDSGGASNE
jgi:tRNA/rRNA methyltransferase